MPQAFSGQRDGEKFLFLFRRSFSTSRKGFLIFLFSLTIAIFLVIIWPDEPTAWLISGIIAILGLFFLFYFIVLWYFTVYLVTSERIRQILQKGFFKRTVLDLDLEKIQSVTCSVPGLFGTIFQYGTIVIQTVAGDLTISSVRKPEKVYNKLQDVINLAKRSQSEITKR